MYFVFDIGGTKTRMGSSFDGTNFSEIKITQTPQNYDLAMQSVVEFIGKQGGLAQNDNKVILGLPGAFNKERTQLLKAAHLPLWLTKPVKADLEKVPGCKVFLENDAALAALGEAALGEGIGKEIVAYITIGTGVGGAKVVGKKIAPAAYGFEPGHQIIDFDASVSAKQFTLDSLVGGAGRETRFGKKSEEIKEPAVWEEIEKFLAAGLSNTIVHWSPEIVVLGGSLMQNEFITVEKIKSYVAENLQHYPFVPEIVKGALGDEAGLKGGLYYLKNQVL